MSASPPKSSAVSPMCGTLPDRIAAGRSQRRKAVLLKQFHHEFLLGCVNTSLGQQFLDIPRGQCEPGTEPDRMADDLWREAVALKCIIR